MSKIFLLATCIGALSLVIAGGALSGIPVGIATVSDQEAQDVTGAGGCGNLLVQYDYDCGDINPLCCDGLGGCVSQSCGAGSCPNDNYPGICATDTSRAGDYLYTGDNGQMSCLICGGQCGSWIDAPTFMYCSGYGT